MLPTDPVTPPPAPPGTPDAAPDAARTPAATVERALASVVAGRTLRRDEAAGVMHAMMSGAAEPLQIAGLLAALATRGETASELAGMVQAMRARAVRVPLPHACAGRPLLDTCGTGGDGAGLFNVSTVAAFVVASAGVLVAKHGNRAASSRCGSADLLEALGATIDLGPDAVADCLRRTNLGFCFAPRYHPAVRHVVPVRRALKVRTVFNLLGPCANPAGATHQLLGVFSRAWVEPLANVLGQLGVQRAMVVHGDDGLDELSLSVPSTVARVAGGRVTVERFEPSAHGLTPVPLEALRGGDAAHNAALTRRILAGEAGAPREMTTLNAAAAFVVAERCENFDEGLGLARQQLDCGAAQATLDAFIAATQVTNP